MSKKILFIVNAGRISPNENGGASVYYSHLELLYKAGYKVLLLAVQWNENYSFIEDDYKEVKEFVEDVITYKAKILQPKKGLDRLEKAIFNPAKFEYYFINKSNNRHLNKLISEKEIDIVWTEWRWAAIWANYAKLSLPIIYAHHDWEYKLALLRSKPTLNKRFHTYQKKRVEFDIIKSVTACISGSKTEAEEIQKISEKKTLYLPTTYTAIFPALKSNEVPDIVHLGGMGTTANRLGLERFLDVCWNDIKSKIPNVKLKVIGSTKNAHSSLVKKLKDSNIECLGFIKNLDTVLHPEDIHVVPWEYNTGTRTRIPVVLNYEQVLVATKASVACFPEINNQNAVLCSDLKQMADEIIALYSSKAKLKILAEKGKETLRKSFTTESQVKNIQQFIDNI